MPAIAPDVAAQREVGGDLLLGDMGQGLGTRTGVFDGAISISAIQVWNGGKIASIPPGILPLIADC